MTKYRFTPQTYWVLALAALTLATGCEDDLSADGPPKPAAHRTYGDAPAAGVPAAPQVNPEAVLVAARPLFGALDPQAKNEANPWTAPKADLGRMLYYETRLSKNHDLSCNSCHDLEKFGVDVREIDGKRTKTSQGHKKAFGDRNSPTVYNAAFHLAQFWDGRAADVEAQAKGPILNPVEMAMPDEATVLATLKSIPGYVEAFEAAFPDNTDPVTYDNMANAIGVFERKLVTPSKFDAFIAGDAAALTGTEAAGLKTFMDVGCTQCHSGALLGGNQFQKLGSVKPWPDAKDEGRFALTKSAPDKFSFKVPSLRNITETGPYLHDGSVESLEVMVQMMAEHQLAKGSLTAEETQSIMTFLGTLKGDVDAAYIKAPTLPPSGPDTPAPDAT
ncbi:MAG: c-type cytochrome [Nannocystaceae bacterium]|nr:c-type cytochrome [Nannocystaceae bacterium]